MLVEADNREMAGEPPAILDSSLNVEEGNVAEGNVEEGGESALHGVDSDFKPKPDTSPNQIRFTAMSLLARREHSRFELLQKLRLRYPDSAALDIVVQQLADEALQSDERFAEAFVAMRVRKGQGPVRIRLELQQRQVQEELIDPALEKYRVQWADLVKEVCRKKYKSPARDVADRTKQSRFLQYRGFTPEQIQSLWNE